jgi:hypothetical protein
VLFNVRQLQILRSKYSELDGSDEDRLVSVPTTETDMPNPKGSGGILETARDFARFASARWFRNNPVRALGLELGGMYIALLEGIAHAPWLASLHLEHRVLSVGGLSLGLLTARLIHWRCHQYEPAPHMREYWDHYALIQHANIGVKDKERMSLALLESVLRPLLHEHEQAENERRPE